MKASTGGELKFNFLNTSYFFNCPIVLFFVDRKYFKELNVFANKFPYLYSHLVRLLYKNMLSKNTKQKTQVSMENFPETVMFF